MATLSVKKSLSNRFIAPERLLVQMPNVSLFSVACSSAILIPTIEISFI